MTNENEKQLAQQKPKHEMVIWLDNRQSELFEYCAHGIKPEMLSRTLATALIKNPAIYDCTPESSWLAITYAARLGLDPTGERNSCWFIPYKNNKTGKTELKLMLGYGGLISLIIRNSDIIDIQCEVVYKGEEFEMLGGTEQKLRHRMDFNIRNGAGYDKVIAAYTIATHASGYKKTVILSRKELDQIAKSAASRDSVWNYNPIEMAKKSPLRNLSKWIDIDPDFNEAIAISDEGDNYDLSRENCRRLKNERMQEHPDSLTNRIESIPSDGKPRETEAERTKREDDDRFVSEISDDMDKQKGFRLQ